MPESTVKCPHCKVTWKQLILISSGVEEIRFRCMNERCVDNRGNRKTFTYKLRNGAWQLVKEKPKNLEEAERFGNVEL